MKKILVILHDKIEPDQFFMVKIPSVSEPGFYRQGVSMDCFRSRELNRFYKKYLKKQKEKYCQIFREDEFNDSNLKWILSHNNIDMDTLPIFDTIFDFYTHINYDYKKKKYLL